MRLVLAFVCACGVAIAAPYEALAVKPGTVLATYPVGAQTTLNGGIATGPDGALWFTLPLKISNAVGRITTHGHVKLFGLPNADSQPEGITAGPDGALWFAETGDGTLPATTVGRIGRITTHGQISEYRVPNSSIGQDPYPYGIVNGPNGNLWFTEAGGNGNQGGIGVITRTGAITHVYPLPANANTADTGAYGMVVGPDHNLWFADLNGDHIGRITPSGQITEFAAPANAQLTGAIAAGSDGRIWVIANSLSTGTTGLEAVSTNGTITAYPIAQASESPAEGVFALSSRPDGALWMPGSNGTSSGGGIVRVTTGGSSKFYPVPGTLGAITGGPDGNIWAVNDSGSILKIATNACVVPKLKGRTLAAAKKALRATSCKLGKVKRPKSHGSKPKLVVRSQSPAAHSIHPPHTKVSLRLVAAHH